MIMHTQENKKRTEAMAADPFRRSSDCQGGVPLTSLSHHLTQMGLGSPGDLITSILADTEQRKVVGPPPLTPVVPAGVIGGGALRQPQALDMCPLPQTPLNAGTLDYQYCCYGYTIFPSPATMYL